MTRPSVTTMQTCKKCGNPFQARKNQVRCGDCQVKTQRICIHCHEEYTGTGNSKSCLPCREHYNGVAWNSIGENGTSKSGNARHLLTRHEYEEMLQSQDNACAICHKPAQGALAIDHDHSTGVVRGLLCSICNGHLGFIKDDPAMIARILEYLSPERLSQLTPATWIAPRDLPVLVIERDKTVRNVGTPLKELSEELKRAFEDENLSISDISIAFGLAWNKVQVTRKKYREEQGLPPIKAGARVNKKGF